ncbi:polymorphic toxin-type HINT domain-containing protein [Streptomyces cucumeris]|uniref:polymorphic toxin-type HINT domain-containing protein n=1 Tax=Streptomyces cucumeris TaxID=2962890 RepID=UPI003D712441
MVATLLQAVALPAVAVDSGKGRPGLPRAEKPVRGTVGKVKARTVMKGPRTPKTEPRATWPEAASAVVSLSGAGARDKAVSGSGRGLPLTLDTSHVRRTKDAAQGDVAVRVLARKASRAAGIVGPMFTLQPKATGRAAKKAEPAKVRAQADYSSFAEMYGGAYATRLTLVTLPQCVLTTPGRQQCRKSTPLDTTNNAAKRTLTASNVSLRADAPTVLAAVAGGESDKGDYKATSLSPSASWDVSLNTGDFGWSYGIPVPETPGSLNPSVGMSYSSGRVDGRTANSNNQSSWVGDGFDLWPGSIERRYKPCADDGVKNADGNKPGDLCWAYDNAFLSFNGKGGELIPDGANSWRMKSDDGTKVERLFGSSDNVRDNGARKDEYWRVITPDGTRYYFGYNRLPGWSSGKESTDSTWTAPVFGNGEGEPCHGASFADSWCQQGWRWNLDYVVDPHGNAIAYYYDKETNSYGRNLKAKDNTRYVRGGGLDRIEYGLRSSSMYSAKALAKVDFSSSERCLPDTHTDCASISKDKFYWYDTPWDLNCSENEDCDDGRVSPVFFTRKRLTGISTRILDGDEYKNVDSWKLVHRWGKADTDYQLELESVQRTGHTASPAVTLPKTTFAYTQLANRLDKTGDGFAPFIKDRLSTVADESGGQIDVDYSAPACDWEALPTPQSNTTRCFPQYTGGSGSEDPERQWFNKYVVTSVTNTDRTGGAPDQVTAYDYKGGAAWHYDDDDGLTKEKFKTWSQWRGYGQVRVQTGGQGGSSAMKSQQDTYFLRGMDGDRKDSTGGEKRVSVALADGEGDPITDHESSAGFSYKTVSYAGPGGRALDKTVHRPWHHQTAKKTRDWGTVTANLTGSAYSKQFTSLDDGAGAKWRTVSTATEYDTVAGRVTQVDDFGDTETAADNKCTRTTYATDRNATILTLPSRVETVSTSCDATANRPADVVSDTRTAYDAADYDAAPTTGDATKSATLKKYDGSTAVYLEAGSTFDVYGRKLADTDLSANVTVSAGGVLKRTTRDDGRTTTTAFTPATGIPTGEKVTSPPVKPGAADTAQTTTTRRDPLRGLPLAATDTNGKVTNFAYDALGRSTKVWLADRLTGQTPSYEFTYHVTEDHPVAVATKTIGNRGVQGTSYTLYDGMLRERQTQAPGPRGGRLLTDVFYDERGLKSKDFASYFAEGKPDTGLFKPEDALSVETQNRYGYDGLGRQTEARQIAGNGDGGKVLGVTRTIYGGDRTTVIPPEGGTATTTLVDARGQTSELRQHRERAADAAYDTTTYAYTPRGDLEKVTDPVGNAWSYGYDLQGRQTRADDPDKGSTVSAYDDRGQLTSTLDARGTTLAYTYDGLGRRTELHKDSAAGQLRAKWVYDTISGAKGHLAESTRYENGREYTTKVVAYDRLYRALRTSVTIPESEGALQGTYLSATTYNVSGLVQGVGYPKAGSLPATTAAYTYEDDTLRPVGFVGGPGIRSATSYSLTGKPQQYELSSDGGRKTWATNTYEWGTQRLVTSRVDRENVAGVDQYSTYRYDEAGNVLSVSDTSRSGTDNQCFTYDYLQRLTEAWTQGQKDCAAEPNAGVLGGPAAYWHSYTYDKVGNRSTETLHDPSGSAGKDVKRTYGYPAPGTPQPHTLTSIKATSSTGTSQDTFGYDKAGNTTARTIGGDAQTLTWDAEGRLAKVTEPGEGDKKKTTEYLYDADGKRLIGRTADETTLYLGTTEITLPQGSSSPKGTRYIDLGGGHQAVQTDDGKVSLTVADHHGTANLAIDAASQKLTQRRTLPFGGMRGEQPTNWPGTRGFVGGTDDSKSTGLTHLGAREYDPSTGRFISVDPVMDPSDPQQIHGYTYANNNPLTYSDPTGLRPDGPAGGAGYNDQWEMNGRWRGVAAGSGWFLDNSGGWSYRHERFVPNPGGSRKSAQLLSYTWSWTAQGKGARSDDLFVTVLGKEKESGFIERAFAASAMMYGEITNIAPALDCAFGDETRCRDFGSGKVQAIKSAYRAVRGWGKESGCHSFVPGTDVLLGDGSTKQIEKVKTGDKVTVTDPKTGRTSVRKVVGTIVTEDDKKFVDLTVDARGKESDALISTTTHPFWVVNQGKWVDAGDLKPGMMLRTPDGDTVKVRGVRHFERRQRTYDLTVNGVHTYYVLAGATPVLVHNSGPCTARAGRAQEDAITHATGILRNPGTGQKSITGPVTGRTRVPDFDVSASVSRRGTMLESKDVATLEYRSQIRDFEAYANDSLGVPLEIIVRAGSGTRIPQTGGLADAISRGRIIITPVDRL